MENKLVAILLQVPAMLLLVGAFIAAIVVRAIRYPGIDSYGPAVVLAVIVGLYFWGRYLERKSDNLI